MTIQIEAHIQRYTQMSQDEKLARVKIIRHVKYVEKPAVKVRAKKAAAPGKRRATKKVETMVNKLTPDQMLALLKELSAE